LAYPRVTEILKAYSNFQYVPSHILENAASRGTTVHAICAGLAKGAWIPDGSIKDEHLGYINSFKIWAEDNVKKYIVIEKRFEDDQRKFTGQVDFVVLDKQNERYLVDIKTSAKENPTYPLQMAAYDHLLCRHDIYAAGAILVYLDKDGNAPKVNNIPLDELKESFKIFDCALTCWHHFNKGKARGEKAA
jgi:hypothetical protein